MSSLVSLSRKEQKKQNTQISFVDGLDIAWDLERYYYAFLGECFVIIAEQGKPASSQ